MISVLSVYGLTVYYYRRRGFITGIRSRTWPTVGTGALVLVIVLMAASWLSGWPITIGANGTEPLAIIAVSLFVLARTEQSLPMTIFASGFAALVCISPFYTDVNAFERVHLAGPFKGSAVLLPNLIVPGMYLVLGGLLFCTSARRMALVEGDVRD